MIKRNQPFRFDVSSLFEAGTGTRVLYSFDGPATFDDIITKSPIKGRVEIMRLEEGLNVRVYEFSVDVELKCTKCLKPLAHHIEISHIERQFLFDLPIKPADPNDLFLVDKKRQEVEIHELLRQEIILHFSSIPVCSVRCKGLCQVCGQNRNEKECDCEIEDFSKHKPFAALKDLLK